jgi:hypothetical protein
MVGAEKIWRITPAIQERLDFELLTISNSGYPGYFLIVQILLPKHEKWMCLLKRRTKTQCYHHNFLVTVWLRTDN